MSSARTGGSPAAAALVPSETTRASLACTLCKIGAIKFGEFTLKSGIISPIYVDLRLIVSFPDLLKSIAELMWDLIVDLPKDVLCGVPYTALPIATAMSIMHTTPMVMRRKEAKAHGLGKMIEGIVPANGQCVVVEDLVTSGASVLETAAPLRDAGLHVHHAVVIIDREQGGRANLAREGITLHSILGMGELLGHLSEAGLIDQKMLARVREFLREKAAIPVPAASLSAAGSEGKHPPPAIPDESLTLAPSARCLSYGARAQLASSPAAARLFELMQRKKSNLCVSADVDTPAELLRLIALVGRHVVLVKTHVDAMVGCDAALGKELARLARELDFLLMEDRKYVDIGHTVAMQHGRGPGDMATWAHFVTAVPLSGPAIVDGLLEGERLGLQTREQVATPTASSSSSAPHAPAVPVAAAPRDPTLGIVLIAEMSSQGSLAKGHYTEAVVGLARSRSRYVAGIVAQSPLLDDAPGSITMTPGVSFRPPPASAAPPASAPGTASASASASVSARAAGARHPGDGLGQQYNEPDAVVLERGADVIIVGRGIIEAADPAAEAARYRAAGWEAYLSRIARR